MTNRTGIAMILLLISAGLSAQTRDSSNAEIQRQALEMREKLNRYMADRLLTGEKPRDSTGVRVFFDSISTALYKQQAEIDELKQRFAKFEELVKSGELGTGQAGTKAAVAAAVAGYEAVGEKQLNLYFAFDEYRLNPEQVIALREFLKGKKIKRASLSGYTDWRGTEQHNSRLARSRCGSVVKILNQLVIHYEVTDKGACSGSAGLTPEKAQWCRRVEVVIR